MPHNFIYNQAENPNLQILTGAKVKKVLFESVVMIFFPHFLNVCTNRGNRAVGVEYVKDTTLNPDSDQTVHIVKSDAIIVSAGAFGSPAILER